LTWEAAQAWYQYALEDHDPSCIPDKLWRPNSILRAVTVMGEVHFHYVVNGRPVVRMIPGNLVLLFDTDRMTPRIRNRINDVLLPMGWKLYASLDGKQSFVRSTQRSGKSEQVRNGMTLRPEPGSEVHTANRQRTSSEVD
jgi:hypothetical protein